MDSYAEAAGKIGKIGQKLLNTLKKGDTISVEYLTMQLKEIVDLAIRQNPLVENIFKTTLYSIGDAVIATDKEGKITLLNPVAEHLTGWSEKDAEGKPLGEIFRIISEVNREAAESPVEKVLRKGVTVGLANHTLLISKQGKEISIADSGAPVLNAEGQISGVVLVFRDQTKEREKNRRILESEKKYKTLFNNRSVIMLLIDSENGDIMDANPAAVKFYGWSAIQLKGKNVAEINQLSKEEIHKEIELAKAEKRNLFKFRHQLANGKIRDVEVYSNPIEIGGVPMLYSIIHDVTHRNKLEAKYKDTQARLLATLENMTDGFVSLNTNWICTYINKRGAALFGREPEDLIGRHIWTEFPVGVRHFYNNCFKAMETRQEIAMEDYYEPMDRWFENRIIPSEKGLSIFYQDITERKKAEETLQLQEQQLRLIYNSVGDILYYLKVEPDDNYRFVTINDRFLSATGLSREQVVNKTIGEVIPEPSLSSLVRVNYLKAIREKRVVYWEETSQYPKGSKTGVVSIAPIFDKEGKCTYLVGSVHDITERKKAEKQLRKLNRTYALLSDVNQTIMHVHEPGALFEAACHIAVEKGGFSMAWIGLLDPQTEQIIPVAHEGETNGYLDKLNIRLGGSKRKPGPTASVLRDGKHVIVNDIEHDPRMAPWREDALRLGYRASAAFPLIVNGEVRGALNLYAGEAGFFDNHELKLLDEMAADIAFSLEFNEQEEQRKQAEIKLAESEKHFRLFYENAPILYQSLDAEGNILEINDMWLRTLGYKREEVVGHSIKEFLSEESMGILQDVFPKFLSTGSVHNVEYELISKKDEKIVVVIEGMIATDKSGKFQQTHCVLHNVTEQRYAEQQIRLLSRSVEQSPVSVMITDINGKLMYVNPKFTEVTGYSGEEVIGKNPRFLKSGEHPPSFFKKLWNTILSGKEWKGEFRNKKKNGEIYWDSSTISPILNEKGDIAYFVGVQEDVTEKKKLHDELVNAKEKAEESDRLKSAFLANISHEIRTPMNGILGFMDLLSEPELKESTKNRYIGIINKSGERLMTTINDIIEISKLEAGQLKVQISDVDISALMDYLFSFFKHQANAKGILLKVNNRLSGSDAAIKTDRQKLEGLLINLLRNAIKFTREGFVEFGNHLVAGQLQFYVRDTGIGIPTDRLEAIFDRFVQADLKLTRPYEGSGLGLSIAKGYTELLGGKIEVESEEGKGSTFYFTIPFHPAKSSIRKTASVSPFKEKSGEEKCILIAEDDEISNLLLEEIFAKGNFKLLHTNKGEDTVKACREHSDIDLILMDIRMPDINGFEATRQIREFNKTVPILAQTAYAMPGDKESALKAGCNDYISKPIDKHLFMAKINRLLKM